MNYERWEKERLLSSAKKSNQLHVSQHRGD